MSNVRMNLRGKVPKERGTRKRPELVEVPASHRGILHLMAFFGSGFTIEGVQKIPTSRELLWQFTKLMKSNGWEHLSTSEINFLKSYCKANNYAMWFDR